MERLKRWDVYNGTSKNYAAFSDSRELVYTSSQLVNSQVQGHRLVYFCRNLLLVKSILCIFTSGELVYTSSRESENAVLMV